MKIIVLMGGTSEERDVSIVSGESIVQGLREKGHQVLAIDTAKGYKLPENQKKFLSEGIKTEPPDVKALQHEGKRLALKTIESFNLSEADVVFLALHGGQGEDGTIQALLELSGIPYTGSGVLASALAMNKAMSKKVFEREGILTPQWFTLESSNYMDISLIIDKVKKTVNFPVAVKPNEQGSSVGLTVVEEEKNLGKAIEEAKMYSEKILFEKYIPGRELTVGILGDIPLPVIEIVPEHGIYDYECKYTKGKSQYVCPAELSNEKTIEIQETGLRAFKALGCEGFARVDFRYGIDDKFYCLEVNTIPGMTATSLVPKAARALGIEFPELVERIAKLAVRKFKGSKV
ncbi:MAG: D-alanine--D-alanine ligase [candidate division Zixibacteria bacterium]|nr:D-alanine--D-alanine ligase [candidate division Zixibacteria bacterium]